MKDSKSRWTKIKTKLAARPKAVQLDMGALFAMADSLNGTPPDDQEWRGEREREREIVAEMLERVVSDGRDIAVSWREEYRPLLTLGWLSSEDRRPRHA